MIDIKHLFWIVPFSASFGCFVMALFAGSAMSNNVPSNCVGCRHKESCKSWYGGSTCKYRDEITGK